MPETMRAPRIRRDQRGFTLIELLVTMTILLVGMGGALAMIEGVNGRTVTTKEREAATALAREVVENTRSVPYPQITDTGVVTALRALSGLEDTTPGPRWTVERRNQVYTIEVSACSVDDPQDGTGEHSAGNYCSGAAGGTTDRNPDDYKRVTVDLTWKRRGVKRSLRQTATIANETNTTGPRIIRFDPTPDTDFITDDVSSIDFAVETSVQAASINYTVDGHVAEVDNPGGITASFVWEIDGADGHVPDGTYLISAVAYDADGRAGVPRSRTIRLNRDLPEAPRNVVGGWNALRSVVEVEWDRNSEPDVTGYRVYRSVGGITELVPGCDLSTRADAKSCIDRDPPKTTADYFVVALDEDPFSSDLREGAASLPVRATPSTNQPNPPETLNAVTSEGGVTLTWPVPAPVDPAYEGSEVAFYRIYRDGVELADRLNRTGDATELSFTDPEGGSGPHTYHLTAVDRFFSESNPIGPVSVP
jgi:prepilin-type N-terminal cleavage/methylation domain-containing protein